MEVEVESGGAIGNLSRPLVTQRDIDSRVLFYLLNYILFVILYDILFINFMLYLFDYIE